MLRLLFAVVSAFSPLFAQMRAGVGSRTVTPDLVKHAPVYMAGFGSNRVAASVHDELYARCFALEPVHETKPIVMCGVDVIGIFWEDTVRIRKAVDSQLGRPANVVIAALHDHEGPDTMGLWGAKQGVSGINEEYNTFLVQRVTEAALDAIHSLQPATLTVAKAHPAVLDTLIADNRPPEVHDAEVIVLSAKTHRGKAIGALINWANHPETLGSKNKEITSDYSGYLRQEFEKRVGGMAVFINGAVGGMQSSLGAKLMDPETKQVSPDNSFRKAELVGTAVATAAADALRGAKPIKMSAYEFREKIVHIPTANEGFRMAAKANLYKGRKPIGDDGMTVVPVGVIRLLQHHDAKLEIALIPGELYPELSIGGIERYSGADYPEAAEEMPIKKMMQAPYRMLFGLADDEIGYIIPKAEWDDKAPWLKDAPKRWYGEVNSVGPEAARLIADAVTELLRKR